MAQETGSHSHSLWDGVVVVGVWWSSHPVERNVWWQVCMVGGSVQDAGGRWCSAKKKAELQSGNRQVGRHSVWDRQVVVCGGGSRECTGSVVEGKNAAQNGTAVVAEKW